MKYIFILLLFVSFGVNAQKDVTKANTVLVSNTVTDNSVVTTYTYLFDDGEKVVHTTTSDIEKTFSKQKKRFNKIKNEIKDIDKEINKLEVEQDRLRTKKQLLVAENEDIKKENVKDELLEPVESETEQ